MSDVETFWKGIAVKANDPRSWGQLQPQEQHMIINAINLVLQVLHNRPA